MMRPVDDCLSPRGLCCFQVTFKFPCLAIYLPVDLRPPGWVQQGQRCLQLGLGFLQLRKNEARKQAQKGAEMDTVSPRASSSERYVEEAAAAATWQHPTENAMLEVSQSEVYLHLGLQELLAEQSCF